MKKNSFIVEMVLAFLILNCVNYIFFRGDPGFINSPLHPYWIVVILISCRYGFVPGLVVGIVAACHILFFTFYGIPTRVELEKLAEAGELFLPVAFVTVGILLGSIRQKYKNAEDDTSDALKVSKESQNILKQKFDAAAKALGVLETRIVGETATVRILYEASKKLEMLDDARIYEGCLSILSEYFKVEKASVYMREGDYLVLKAHHGWTDEEAVEGKVLAEKSIMKIVLDEGKFITVKDILARKDSDKYLSQYNKVLAMFPVSDEEGNTIGIVNIEKIDFLLFTKPTLQMIELVVDWTGRALYNKHLYDAAAAEMIWDKEYGVCTFNYFEKSASMEFERARRYKLDLTISILKIGEFGFLNAAAQELVSKTIVALIRRFVPDTDLVFRYKYDGTFAVISPMRKGKEVSESFKKVADNLREMSKTSAEELKRIQLSVGSTEIDPKIKDFSELVRPGLKECKIALD